MLEVRKLNEIINEIKERMDYLQDLEDIYKNDQKKMDEVIARYSENKRIYNELKELFKYE